MANVIHISEEGNRLYFERNYTPVVCANSNYFVIFDFSEEWLALYHKTAVFVVDGRKKQMDFEGHVLNLPAFPNAPYFEMLVYAKDGDMLYSTTAIKIRLEPTHLGNLIKFNFGGEKI